MAADSPEHHVSQVELTEQPDVTLEKDAREKKDANGVPDNAEDGVFVIDGNNSRSDAATADFWETFAGVVGNVLEWYDFAVFGFLSDVIGDVFFPANQKGHLAIAESFAVFGGAFLMRPIGGVAMGYIGDKYGSKDALILSIFLMAFPTFLLGCLPSYEKVGSLAIFLLIVVRLLQGFSVGGNVPSSAVYTLESHPREHWGFYGSLVLMATNVGTLIGSLVGWGLRSSLTDKELHDFGWRIPFIAGVVVSFAGYYLKEHGEKRPHIPSSDITPNPIALAFANHNRRSLLAASMVPMLWASGFYLSFVWIAIFMNDLIEQPVPGAFGVNAISLFLSVCLFFPVAGGLSDRFGRRNIMTIGGIFMGLVAPVMFFLIGTGSTTVALLSQIIVGISLSLWGAPMITWLVESFEPEARLTSVAIGYNLAQALVGGLSPAMATLMVDYLGPSSPGIILIILAAVGLTGLWCVATPPAVHEHGDNDITSLQLHVPTTIGLQPVVVRKRHKKGATFSGVPVDDVHQDLDAKAYVGEEEAEENQII